MKWTAQADALLIGYWSEGLSMAHIAKAMVKAGHEGVNRNMVAGRKEKLTRKGVEFEVRDNPFDKVRRIVPPPRVEEISPVGAVSHDRGVDYLLLGSQGCKAILDKVGEYGLPMCCGKLRVDATSYCVTHLRLYTNPQFGGGRRSTNGQIGKER